MLSYGSTIEQRVPLRVRTQRDNLMYWSGAHSRHKLMYHLVWLPKYRKRILKEPIAGRLRELFYECAEINEWEIKELNIKVDHIHMLIQIKPSVSVSHVVQMFKGGSSKVIRIEFPGLKEFLWGTSFWNDGYFAETVGHSNQDKIAEYIKNQ